ncbi:UNVERIFIED_CONTAM: hypothetical protein K2H54_013975 [Gekko kuhli]
MLLLPPPPVPPRRGRRRKERLLGQLCALASLLLLLLVLLACARAGRADATAGAPAAAAHQLLLGRREGVGLHLLGVSSGKGKKTPFSAWPDANPETSRAGASELAGKLPDSLGRKSP